MDRPAIELTTVNALLAERSLSWALFGERLGVSKQVCSNWKARGCIPSERALRVASVLGVSVERLYGAAAPAAQGGAEEGTGAAAVPPARSGASAPAEGLCALEAAALEAFVAACRHGRLPRTRVLELLNEWEALVER